MKKKIQKKKTTKKTEKTFIDQIQSGLLSEKDKIQSILSAPKPMEAVDFDGDEIDEVQGKQLIELANQLKSRNELKLIRIESALRRIEDKNFGICQDCGDDISEKRLIAQPLVVICIGCAEEQENTQKHIKTKERVDDMTIIKKWSTK